MGGRITYGRLAPWLLRLKEERKENKRNGELAFTSQQSACVSTIVPNVDHDKNEGPGIQP
jgi:hypothetical protein